MFEKRTYYKLIQDWQKTVATVFLILLVSTCIGQTSVEAELSTRNGLPSDIGRIVLTDEDGGVWVGTDGGIRHFPSGNANYDKIEKTINHSQVWALEFEKDWMYVGTYDNGLFIFNKKNGELVNHIKYNKLPKIRKFRRFNNKVYAIYFDGVFELHGPDVNILLNRKFFRTKRNGNTVRTFPLEIFQWNNQLNVIVYNSKVIYNSKFGEHDIWDSTDNLLPQTDSFKLIKNITSAFSWKNKLFIGTAGFGLFLIDSNSTKQYQFIGKIKQNLTAWDIKPDKDELYIGFGNHIDFSEGYILRYSDLNSVVSNQKIQVNDLIRTPFVWSLTPDTMNQSIWVATINKGFNYYPSLKHYRVTPGRMDQLHSTKNYIIGSYLNNIYVQNRNQNFWNKITLKNSKLISCLEYENGIVFLCNNKVYYWNNNNLRIVFDKSSSFMELIGSKLYLFSVFGSSRVIDLNNEESIPTELKPNYREILAVISDNKRIIIQTLQDGFYLIQDDKSYPLKTDFLNNKVDYQFNFYGNLLVLHSAHEYRFCAINETKKKLETQFISNSKGLFRNIKIKWSYTQLNSGFWVGNDEVAFQLSLSPQDSSFTVINQYYLGKMDLFRTIPLVKYNEILIQRQDYIQSIHFTEIPSFSFNANIDISHKNPNHLGELILPRIFVGQNANFSISSNNYFFNEYGTVEYWVSHKGETPKHFIQPVKSGIWLNNYPAGIYRIQISTGFNTFTTLLRVNERIFWALIIVIVLLGTYLYQWNQHEQFKVEQKMISLEIATLRSNMNPHFIFNTMNLIQSLIVRNQSRKAIKATSDLARLNRKFLEYSNHEFVSLHKEIGFIEDYIQLEQMRFEEDNKFDFNLDVAEDVSLDGWQIPPLILQPLLENAIKHGTLISKSEHYLKVQITLNTPSELQIIIINPFEPYKKSQHGTRMGLKLVKDRLVLINQRYENEFEGNIDFQIDEIAQIYTTILTFSKRHKQ